MWCFGGLLPLHIRAATAANDAANTANLMLHRDYPLVESQDKTSGIPFLRSYVFSGVAMTKSRFHVVPGGQQV